MGKCPLFQNSTVHLRLGPIGLGRARRKCPLIRFHKCATLFVATNTRSDKIYGHLSPAGFKHLIALYLC